MHIDARRPRLRALALLVVLAGSLTIAAHAASGFEPAKPTVVPDSAFRPVVVPPAPGVPEMALGAAGSPAPGSTPDLGPVYEPVFATAHPDRAQPSLPAADARVIVIPTPTPKPTPTAKPASGGSGGSGGGSTGTTHKLVGAASWYCRAGVSICTSGYPDGGGFDAYAAAGPKLRAALGDWRGRIVYVDGIKVKLIDWCQCYKGEPNEKLLDLYYDVFARTGSSVTIRW